MADDLSLIAGGKNLKGWTEIALTRSIQQMPNTFSVSATEDSPLYTDASFVREGQACTVKLGSDLVITGYVDQVGPGFGVGAHAVIVGGRGKCQDLVDCSAEWTGSQVRNSNPLQIAQKLSLPYGITASCVGDPGDIVPQFNINVGDSAANILEMVTRHAGLLYYEGTDGNLILSRIGVTKAASGVVQGKNIQACRLLRSVAERYSEIVCSLVSVDTSGLYQDQDGLTYYKALDPNVSRHRRLAIVAEGVDGGRDLAKRRALWECARRAGRGRVLNVTVDSWRDGKGKLWAPNTLVPIDIPKLGLSKISWCLAEVTYRAGLETGLTADLVLMTPESFTPEPIMIQPVLAGVVTPGAPAASPAPGG